MPDERGEEGRGEAAIVEAGESHLPAGLLVGQAMKWSVVGKRFEEDRHATIVSVAGLIGPLLPAEMRVLKERPRCKHLESGRNCARD